MVRPRETFRGWSKVTCLVRLQKMARSKYKRLPNNFANEMVEASKELIAEVPDPKFEPAKKRETVDRITLK